MYKRIKLAIAVIKTTAVFINDVKSIYVIPLLGTVALLIFYVIWVIGFIFLYSIGTYQI
jgi:hypothetical protein